MAKVPVSEQVQVNFRMPANLRDRIKAAADANGVSMNAEIVASLQARYPEPLKPMQIVEDMALNLGFVDEHLREEAIRLFVKLVQEGRIAELIEDEQTYFKHRHD